MVAIQIFFFKLESQIGSVYYISSMVIQSGCEAQVFDSARAYMIGLYFKGWNKPFAIFSFVLLFCILRNKN